MYDFLFELTCGDNEGEFILCEAENLDAAYWCLVFENGFEYEELRQYNQCPLTVAFYCYVENLAN